MSPQSSDDFIEPIATGDPEIARLLAQFDVPAFVRRGQELESALERLWERCRRARKAMLEMVHLRLREWTAIATGHEDGDNLFAIPIARLCSLIQAEPASWARVRGSRRRRRAAAANLAASITRFNGRWKRYVQGLDLETINRVIAHYNRYYVLEKECFLRSARVAARYFRPMAPITPERILAEFPLLLATLHRVAAPD